MDFSANILYSVVNNLMLKIVQSFIRLERVGKDRRACQHLLPYFLLQSFFLRIINDLHAYTGVALSAPLQDAEYGSLILAACAGDLSRTSRLVHVAGLAADVGFVRFHLPREQSRAAFGERETQAVVHEPCGLLCHAKSTGRLTRADSVLAINNEPQRREPFLQSERRVFKNGPGLQGKLRAGVFAVALPDAILGKPRDLHRSAMGALYNAILP